MNEIRAVPLLSVDLDRSTVDDLITADIGQTFDCSTQLIGRGGGVVGEGRVLPSLSFPLCLSSAVQFSLGGRLERVLLVSSSAFLCGADSEVWCYLFCRRTLCGFIFYLVVCGCHLTTHYWSA